MSIQVFSARNPKHLERKGGQRRHSLPSEQTSVCHCRRKDMCMKGNSLSQG